MGLLGAIRACTTNIDGPLWRCPEIWVTPELLTCAAGWSLKLDDEATPWRLDTLVGQHFAYEMGDSKAIWRITAVDHERFMLLGRWPD